tara:strand:- start:172 stop:375 length:204 start_codon:yes stop_codon:yes gene_type:complete
MKTGRGIKGSKNETIPGERYYDVIRDTELVIGYMCSLRWDVSIWDWLTMFFPGLTGPLFYLSTTEGF